MALVWSDTLGDWVEEGSDEDIESQFLQQAQQQAQQQAAQAPNIYGESGTTISEPPAPPPSEPVDYNSIPWAPEEPGDIGPFQPAWGHTPAQQTQYPTVAIPGWYLNASWPEAFRFPRPDWAQRPDYAPKARMGAGPGYGGGGGGGGSAPANSAWDEYLRTFRPRYSAVASQSPDVFFALEGPNANPDLPEGWGHLRWKDESGVRVPDWALGLTEAFRPWYPVQQQS